MLDVLKKIKLDKKKILLIIAASLVVIYLDFAFLIKSQFRSLRDIRSKITKLKKELGNLNKDLTIMRDLEQKQTDIKQETISKVKKIITEEQLPLLIQDISRIANKHDVKIMQIKPVKDLKVQGGKASNIVSSDIGKLTSILITLDLTCGYHNLGSFINDLDNSEQFIAMIEELKIISDPADYLRQRVNLALKIYVKK